MLPSPELEALMREFSQSGVRELHIRSGEFELYLSDDASAPTVLRNSQPDEPKIAASNKQIPSVVPEVMGVVDLPSGAIIVGAPNLGTFYRAPKPGAANYVEIGSDVNEGKELCLIEVMKLFTSVQSPAAGTIHAVLAADGEMVEAGQPLFAIVNG